MSGKLSWNFFILIFFYIKKKFLFSTFHSNIIPIVSLMFSSKIDLNRTYSTQEIRVLPKLRTDIKCDNQSLAYIKIFHHSHKNFQTPKIFPKKLLQVNFIHKQLIWCSTYLGADIGPMLEDFEINNGKFFYGTHFLQILFFFLP